MFFATSDLKIKGIFIKNYLFSLFLFLGTIEKRKEVISFITHIIIIITNKYSNIDLLSFKLYWPMDLEKLFIHLNCLSQQLEEISL